MKNAKIVKICQIVVQICNITVIIAQAIANAFPNKSSEIGNFSQEDLKLIKDFMEQEKN